MRPDNPKTTPPAAVMKSIREAQNALNKLAAAPPPTGGGPVPRPDFDECREMLKTKFHQHPAAPVVAPTPMLHTPPVYKNQPQPPYGCLKNGTLPTYRVWKQGMRPVAAAVPKVVYAEPPPPIVYRPLTPDQRTITEQYQKTMLAGSQSPQSPPPPPPVLHQKTTRRRRYVIGKNKYEPKVSVLLSNSGLRNTIKQKCNQLKTIPLAEVKRDLVKKGLIKIGTDAPNDVLRKMFEESSLLCGTVQNHNNDTLLHNYLMQE